MSKGRRYRSEKESTIDERTGVTTYRLTSARGWHILPYFTNTSLTPDSKTVAFQSDRSGKTDIYSVDVESGEITQLTDIPADIRSPSFRYPSESIYYPKVRCDLVSWIDRKVYFCAGNAFRRVDVDTLEEELLWEMPDEIIIGRPHMNSAGTHLLFPAMDVEMFNIPEEQMPMRQHYVWKRVCEDPDVMSYLMVLDISTGRIEEWMRENAWISHAQFSPLDINRILYCHEGVWEDVDDRIWMFDRTTGKKWGVRGQTHDVCIGHEIWIPNSERILYHGWIGDQTLIGFINADGSDEVEYLKSPRYYGHFCPNRDGRVVVTDSGIYRDMISLVTFTETQAVYHPLCRHGSIWKHQWDHPHPHFSPDGRHVVFNASHSPNNSGVYIVEVPAEYRTAG